VEIYRYGWDKGAAVKFNDDITVFIPTRHLEKEDGNKLKKGETAEIEIIEFNKRIQTRVCRFTYGYP
jgi:small subunit ribosomal protein S1